MEPYKCVVIGCGKVGMEYGADKMRVAPRSHIEAVLENAKTKLVAVCDLNAAQLNEVNKYILGINTYSDTKKCLDCEKPDIAIIASSTNSHKDLINLVCDAGIKMVICEKPLCGNAIEAEKLINKLQDSGIVFVLNYQRRFFPLFQNIKHKLSQGKIGRIQQISCCYSNGLYNNAGHLLDAVMFLTEERAVTTSGIINKQNCVHPKNDSNIDGFLELESGAKIAFQSFNQDSYGIHELTIYGTTGLVVIKEHGYSAEWKSVKINSGIPIFETDESIRSEESFVKGALDEVIKCYEQGKSPSSGLKNGTDVLIALDSLVKSALNDGLAMPIKYKF